MTYKTLMVHVELGRDNDQLLEVVAELAERFQSKVIGIAACQPIQIMYGDGGSVAAVVDEEYAAMEGLLGQAEAQFRAKLTPCVKSVEWRGGITPCSLADYISEQARSADLVISGPDLGFQLLDTSKRVNIGELALRLGRPLLIVPHGISSLPLNHACVGWKDTREARQAVVNALPMLQLAKEVTVLSVAHEGGIDMAKSAVCDVSNWLEGHSIKSRPVWAQTPDPKVDFLRAELLSRECDLLVAGAYGHARLTELVFGGATFDVLLNPQFCVLITH